MGFMLQNIQIIIKNSRHILKIWVMRIQEQLIRITANYKMTM